jgi:hypothetical protein
MLSRPDMAMARLEIGGYFRCSLPWRILLLLPAGIFLSVWSWRVASPFAAVVWIVVIALEPRINNIFYQSPAELEALSLYPADWRRVVLIKNASTVLIGGCALALVSVVLLWFSPEALTRENVRGAALYLMTVSFPLLGLGNESSLRYPRRNAGAFSGGVYEAAWMSLTLLAVSVPYFLITGLVETDWLCVPYAAVTAATWYYRSVVRTAAHVTKHRNDIWMRTGTS